MARKHTLDEVLKSLKNKHDVKIDSLNKTIKVLKGNAKIAKNDVGNGSWGKIDYLVKVHGYDLFRVNDF